MKDMKDQVHALYELVSTNVNVEGIAEKFTAHVEQDWVAANGAKLVAKAWVDADFKSWLMADGKAAAQSLGFTMPEHHGSLVVKENTETLQNVICCTLCSCTAFTIIGMAPGWYKDLEYRSRVVREARTVLRELGLPLADDIRIRVWDTTADTRYMVLPYRPPYTSGWSEGELASIVTKDSMIGVARLEPPYAPIRSLSGKH